MSSGACRDPIRVALVAAWLIVGAVGGAAAQNGAAALDEGRRQFDAEIARYAALRARLEESLPSLDDRRRDTWTLLLTRRYLASAIRTARRAARQGSIFDPAAALFRETIARAIYDTDIEGLVDALPGEDAVALDLAVNEPLADWALVRVPPALLERLPPLPAAIEYRLAGGALILWDTHAEILIDALPDAFVVR